MSMLDWGKREIEIAVARERAADGTKEDEFSYGGACYESAYKAFASLCEDGHSGMSIGYTQHILNRLIDGKPLTPIEDTEDIWELVSKEESYTSYQCKRMYSLFKDVYADGSVQYADNDRYYCKNIRTGSTYTFGLMSRVLDELYPITMPYIPMDKPYVFHVEEMKLQDTPGDFDTIILHSITTPEGEVVEMERYYTDDELGQMIWITKETYEKMVEEYIHRGTGE